MEAFLNGNEFYIELERGLASDFDGALDADEFLHDEGRLAKGLRATQARGPHGVGVGCHLPSTHGRGSAVF